MQSNGCRRSAARPGRRPRRTVRYRAWRLASGRWRSHTSQSNDSDVAIDECSHPAHVGSIRGQDRHRPRRALCGLGDRRVHYGDAGRRSEHRRAVGSAPGRHDVTGTADPVEPSGRRRPSVPTGLDPYRDRHDHGHRLPSPPAPLVDHLEERQRPTVLAVGDVPERMHCLVVEHDGHGRSSHALARDRSPAAYTSTSSAVAPGRNATISLAARRISAGSPVSGSPSSSAAAWATSASDGRVAGCAA